MRAVAVRRVSGFLARTQHDRFALFGAEAQGGDARSFALVGAIAEGLKQKDTRPRKCSISLLTFSEGFGGRRKRAVASGAVGDHPHLFLTVAACAPGVAFLRGNLHPIGQPSSRDTLGGPQAGLNLRGTSVIRCYSEQVHRQAIRAAFDTLASRGQCWEDY